MTGSPLIALPPSPASPDGSVVAGDGWWPDIDCNAARDALRLGEIITQPRLAAALEGAMFTITGDLGWWQAALVAGNSDTLLPAWPGDIQRLPSDPCTSLATVTAAQLLALREHFPQDGHGGGWGWGGAYGGDYHYDEWRHHRHIRRWLYSPAQAAQLTAEIGGTSRLVMLYTRAVRFAAAAELVAAYRDFGATHHADIRAEALVDPAADYSRMALQAVRDMLATPRVSVELI